MSILRLEGIKRKVTKIKRIKDYSYWKRLGNLGFTTLLERRMRSNLIESFKIMEFLIMVNIFSIFLLELEIYYQGRFPKLNLLTKWDSLLIY